MFALVKYHTGMRNKGYCGKGNGGGRDGEWVADRWGGGGNADFQK